MTVNLLVKSCLEQRIEQSVIFNITWEVNKPWARQSQKSVRLGTDGWLLQQPTSVQKAWRPIERIERRPWVAGPVFLTTGWHDGPATSKVTGSIPDYQTYLAQWIWWSRPGCPSWLICQPHVAEKQRGGVCDQHWWLWLDWDTRAQIFRAEKTHLGGL